MFVVCGEALMDVYMGEATPTGMLLDARIGGSPLNAVRAEHGFRSFSASTSGCSRRRAPRGNAPHAGISARHR